SVMFAARPSYRHSEEVFEEEEMDGLLHSDALSSPVFSPTPLMRLQHLQQLQHSPSPAVAGSSHYYRRESTGSKQQLAYRPPPIRSSPFSSLSSSSSTSPTHSGGGARQRRVSRSSGTCSSSTISAAGRPELLRLRGNATNESYASPSITTRKQLLSLSPSYHSGNNGRRPSFREKEKETLTLRPPPIKPLNNVCLYCYRTVCALYSIHGRMPPRIEDEGEWKGHLMKKGDNIECYRLREIYRNQQPDHL
ncbi:hypothetical protein PFISCL1PPCAC_18475, partial [Pristionchus fissidentatus]